MGDKIDSKVFDHTIAEPDATQVDLLGTKSSISRNDVHSMLSAAGFVPFFGNMADAVDSVLHAAHGEYGEAAISAAAMVPVIGQYIAAQKALKKAHDAGEKIVTLYRGVDKWHRGQMVKKGSYVGGGGHVHPRLKESLWVTESKSYAKRIADKGDGTLLKFQVPESYFKKHFTQTMLTNKKRGGVFHEGLPKEFLIKVRQ